MRARPFRSVLFLGAALAGVGALPAAAQEVGDDEIVVTAQRREQSLQDVPITLSVVSSQQIQNLAADDVGDLSAFVPGLAVSNASPTQARYSIRGVTTSDFGVGTDPAVGVYVDGVYSARSGAGLLAFNDVARVEVLKGPQGTLFGRNSAAGAVSITTNQPSHEFESSLGLRLGNFGKRRLEGLINVPLAEGLAFRGNAIFNQREGFRTDAATGQDYDTEDNWAARASLGWDVSPSTRAVLTWNHDSLDQDARPAIGIAPLPAAPATPGIPLDPATYLNPFSAPVFNDVVDNHETRELDEGILNITHNFGSVDLTSLTAYRFFQTENREDEDGTNRPDLYFDTNNREHNQSWYQEFRLAGEAGRVDWIAGASYYNERARQRSDTFTSTDTINTLLANTGQIPFIGLIDDILLSPGDPNLLRGHPWQEDIINSGEYDAYAVFGDAIWHVDDRLSLTFGVRWTRDEKSFIWSNGPRLAADFDAALAALEANGALGGLGLTAADLTFDAIFDLSGAAGIPCDNGVTVAEGVSCQLNDSWENVSPRLVADYQITPDVMVFASYARGYKAGGFNSVEFASRFDNEDVTNYEIGIKSELRNTGLRLNASVFSYIYENKQAIRLISGVVGSSVPQYLIETSDDEAWGVDLQADWSVTDAFNIFLNAQYIDVTYKTFVQGTTDLSGQPTGEPLWNVAGGIGYHGDFGTAGTWDAQLIHAFRGESRCNTDSIAQGSCGATLAPFEVGAAQSRTDVRIYWTTESEHVRVGAFVNNIFDNEYVTGVNNITAETLGTPFVDISEPRLYGVDVTLNF